MADLNETSTKDLSCSYCESVIVDDNYLECQECEHNVHIKCLPHASTPGDLLGDIFFDFTCIKCVRKELKDATGATVAERFVRQRIPWLLVISLTLYNLSIKSKGLGHHGYFHWRTHIISFLEKNWNYIFGPRVRRRKQWVGSVSGNLSHNSPEYFQSGADLFQESGWWKLANPHQTPRSVRNQFEEKQTKRLQQRSERRLLPVDENSCNSDISVTDTQGDVKPVLPIANIEEEPVLQIEACARVIPYMGRPPKLAKLADIEPNKQKPTVAEEAAPQPFNTVQESLMDFLAENLGGEDLTMFNNLPSIIPEPLIGAGKSDFFMTEALLEAPTGNVGLLELETNFVLPPNTPTEAEAKLRSFYAAQNEPTTDDNATSSLGQSAVQNVEEDDEAENIASNPCSDEESDGFQPRIVQVTNFQAQECPPEQAQTALIKEEPMEVTQNEDDQLLDGETAVLEPCKPSGFVRQPRRNWPWLVETHKNEDATETDDAANLRLMSVYEEQQMHQHLQKIFDLEKTCSIDIPAYVRRFYRKLCVRKWKREHNRPIFNLDEHIDPTAKAKAQIEQQQSQILDRYQLITNSRQDSGTSFYARIAGCTQYELFESPYTQRVLHPFIFRSSSIGPPWLRLMCELQHRVNGVHPSRATIDFCYVRPQHIAAVNALLQNAFWPGIDVSDCLSYPDYSVVALYKKLVVGCGFLVPDVGYNEAYISFMAVRPNWQRSGIATFMLYHLIQTCMSKDITLHVSATNSAVMLYQKFGFKIEEIILDFYDKYLPMNSRQSRNAFFLRLLR